MKETNRNEYVREYIKDTYKTVKVYIREEEYPAIIEHMKTRGYTKLSGYIKDLIQADMKDSDKTETPTNIHNSNGVIVGNNGTINM